MTRRPALRCYRAIVRLARGAAADLRRPDAEATFVRVCDAAAARGRAAHIRTIAAELSAAAWGVAQGWVPRMSADRPRRVFQRGWSLHDWRLGARALVRSHRSFLTVSVLVLGLSVGMNLTVFTIVNALWIRPLPFPHADRVVVLANSGFGRTTIVRDAATLFDGGAAGQLDSSGAYSAPPPQISFAGDARALDVLPVTPAYFRVLQLGIRGRDFVDDDDRVGAEPVVIISDAVWARLFQRRPDVLGQLVAAQPQAVRIIGVAPPSFHGARRGETVDVWLPFAVAPRLLPSQATGTRQVVGLGRLGPAQTLSAVQSAVSAWAKAAGLTETPTRVVALSDRVYGAPLTRTLVIDERRTVALVAGLALLVLLGGCATIAALVLVHYERRRSELALKMALGSSRARLVVDLARDLLTVGAAGCAAGLAVAAVCLRVLPSLQLRVPSGIDLSRLDLTIDWRVTLFALVVTVVTLAAAAVRPIAGFTRGRLAADLVAGSAGVSPTSQRLRQTLLSVQVAATIVVLIAAGLFVRAVRLGFSSSPGFAIDETLFVTIRHDLNLQIGDHVADTLARASAARDQVLREQLRSMAGVDDVASGVAPIGPAGRFTLKQLIVGDAKFAGPVGLMRGDANVASALGMRTLAGRALTPADAAITPTPALVTVSLAQRLWPGANALGQMVRSSDRLGAAGFEVVGVVSDLVYGSMTDSAGGVLITAQPIADGLLASFVVRTRHPRDVEAAIIRSMDRGVVTVVSGRTLVANDIGRQRTGAWFFSAFGLVALSLGVSGAFGLVAYLAESRRLEMCVRLALGATQADLRRHGLRSALVPVVSGVIVGLAVAALVSRAFASSLPGISALDPLTFVSVGLVVIVAATLASLAASRRLRRAALPDALRASL